MEEKKKVTTISEELISDFTNKKEKECNGRHNPSFVIYYLWLPHIPFKD
jgi:hypothetical protein